MNRLAVIFLFTFVLAFLAQYTLWHNFEFVDKENWIEETDYFNHGDYTYANTRTFYGYPGTTVMMAAAGAYRLGGSIETGLIVSLSLFIALSAAGIAVITKLLRPNSLWWIIAPLFIVFNSLYDVTTPPSAIVSPLIVLLFLLSLYIYEQQNRSFILAFTWAVVLGISMATRLDISLAVGAPLFLFLFSSGKKHAWRVLFISLLTFATCNPYMWVMPIQHITDIVHKILFHYQDMKRDLPLRYFVNNSLLGIIGYFVGVIFLFNKHISLVPDKKFTALTVGITTVISAILFHSSYRPFWYFHPFIFYWEIMAVLYLFAVAEHFYLAPGAAGKKRILQHVLPIIIVILFIGGRFISTLDLYLIPESPLILPVFNR